MRRNHVGASDGADSSIGGEDDDGGEGWLKGSVQKGEALDIEHVDFVDEEDSGDELGHSLVDVPVYDFVDFSSEFFGDLGLFGFHDLSHETHEVVSSLRPGIGHIQIMEWNVLDDLLLFVHVSLWKGNVLFSFKIEFAGIGVASSYPFHVSGRGFDVDHVSDLALLSGQVFMDWGFESELFGSFGGFQSDDYAGDYFVSWSQIVLLLCF